MNQTSYSLYGYVIYVSIYLYTNIYKYRRVCLYIYTYIG